MKTKTNFVHSIPDHTIPDHNILETTPSQ